MIRAVIADDEPLARLHLRKLLEDQAVEVVGEAGDSSLALQMAEDLRPDLLMLDIRMPGLSGLQTAEALTHLDAPPLIVFVTGYSEYAADAFERDALDYLLKPVSPARLAKTLTRARGRLTDQQARQDAAQAIDRRAIAEAEPLRRLPIRGDFAVRLIRVEEILCAVAREKRVYVRTKDGGEHRTYYTLAYLESVLPATDFLRIHDSCLVQLGEVEELLFLGSHAYEVRLSDTQRLPVSRTRYSDLQRRLGLDVLKPA
ncbi:DNA-binding response regulator [Capsulimonas corticalis]|uniref:DNA-binding response regulator n=1 Tax=Capsulimonas corticalis TaxID=2219043 RepID=A0A402CZR7_9BACT|nr:response regulator [Capsulimonas corticalis]BDI33862.1 DNA-binding response regulator [Capsulimonas corticalis]